VITKLTPQFEVDSIRKNGGMQQDENVDALKRMALLFSNKSRTSVGEIDFFGFILGPIITLTVATLKNISVIRAKTILYEIYHIYGCDVRPPLRNRSVWTENWVSTARAITWNRRGGLGVN
jgi:hypothetical protein